ncbi:MAG: hypothetical protein EAZ74_02290 [Alphaproteobacteria bacterium]|nr:MAG: hypothetical protein EAY76_06505 [Alphaproteobacteria bacterium]TAF15167.1 MAG: hypothetical protein EAZ74_02290 [Alphaproteobacteria bacterium]TAF41516.1 MAG: hypothetical protein EAZ66_01215 [Alphaproteobacteria bacterium]TAF77040.1 MAG: hypothetical protein EAZ52_02655 [Alphaproteobacteria bacterium]
MNFTNLLIANFVDSVIAALEQNGFQSLSVPHYPQIRVVAKHDKAESTLQAFAEIQEATPELLAHVAEKAPSYGVLIFVSDFFQCCAISNYGIVFINTEHLTLLHYLGTDGHFHPLSNLAAVIAHELEHLRNHQEHFASFLRETQMRVASSQLRAMTNAIRSSNSISSSENLCDYFYGRMRASADQELNPAIEEVLDVFATEFFAIYREEFVVNGYAEVENPSIAIENVFHARAGEPLRAFSYAEEVHADSPNFDKNTLTAILWLWYSWKSLAEGMLLDVLDSITNR